MKPKDLKAPFSWNERKVLIQDRVWYVPDYYRPEVCPHYSPFTFPGWKQLFGNDHSVAVEYCAGNGLWITEKARAFPKRNWVAVEKRFDRVRKIWSKIHNEGLTNLMVVCGEAFSVTRDYFPEDSIAMSYIHFPDPWPKERHAKHRLIHGPFLGEVERTLRKGGKLIYVSDDRMSVDRFIKTIEEVKRFRFCCHHPYFVTDWPEYGTSYFEALWRRLGRTIHYVPAEAT